MAQDKQAEAQTAEPLTISDADFQRVNWAIRMAEKSSALEVILKSTMHAAGVYQNLDPKQWVRLRPSARRNEIAESLNLAAEMLNAIAYRLREESEKVGP